MQPHLSAVNLAFHKPLQTAHQIVERAYFIESGVASVMAMCNGRECEVAIVGREGMIGLPCMLGDGRTTNKSLMLVPGRAQVIPAIELRSAMAASASLSSFLLRYTYAWLILATQTALANAHGKLEERLARWLLMAHDRADGDELPLTHELLARVLGVRRAGVTVALHQFNERALISAKRGTIVVQDREGLVKTANGFYGPSEATFSRLFSSDLP